MAVMRAVSQCAQLGTQPCSRVLKGLPVLFGNILFCTINRLPERGSVSLPFQGSKAPREHRIACPRSLGELGSQPGPSPLWQKNAGKSRSQELCILEGRERERTVFRQPGMLNKNISSLSTERACVIFQPDVVCESRPQAGWVPAALWLPLPCPLPPLLLPHHMPALPGPTRHHISNLRAGQRKSAGVVSEAGQQKARTWVLVLPLTK